jgi:hypothetical protein
MDVTAGVDAGDDAEDDGVLDTGQAAKDVVPGVEKRHVAEKGFLGALLDFEFVVVLAVDVGAGGLGVGFEDVVVGFETALDGLGYRVDFGGLVSAICARHGDSFLVQMKRASLWGLAGWRWGGV